MLIIHGQRRTERMEGFVADFCLICRRESAFKLVRIGQVSHLYGVSIGAGKLQGHTRRCLRCDIECWTDRKRYLATAKQFSRADLDVSIRMGQLIQQTIPALRSTMAERMDIEEQIRRGPLSLEPSLRRFLIKEPFQALEYAVSKRFESIHIDLPLLWTVLIGIAAVVAAGMLSFAWSQDQGIASIAIVVAIAVAVIVITIQGQLVKGRYLRARIYPLLSSALKLLTVSPPEVHAAIAELRLEGLALASRIKPAQLFAAGQSRASVSQVIR